MSEPTTSDLGVYVHIPFCEHVCPYCDFAVEGVGSLEASLEAPYVEAVRTELERVCENYPELAGRPLATVYLGGGTPSLLTGESVERLLGVVRAWFPGDPQEVTLELNPGLPECERVKAYLDAGVTRLSVGLQSLRDTTLQRLGRGHKAEEARRGLELCLAAGFRSLSVDLIFGAPQQSAAMLLEDLEEVIALGIPHVSGYALTLEPGTPFAKAHAKGRLPLPDEDEQLRQGRLLRARLTAAGYEQYEISSFARPGHRAHHNQRYWQRRDVLGLGPSAASLLGRRRFQNPRARSDWGEKPVAIEVLSEADVRRETLYLGFRRLEGISRSGYRRRFGAPPEAHFPAELAELRELDLVTEQADRLRLTERGILFADEVFLRFVGR